MLLGSGFAWSNVPSMAPMKDPGPLSQIEAYHAFLRSDYVVSATCLEKPAFQMSHWIVSMWEAAVTPDTCGTYECEA